MYGYVYVYKWGACMCVYAPVRIHAYMCGCMGKCMSIKG